MKKIALLSAIALIFSSCASIYLKKANKEFDHMMYSDAIGHYNKALIKINDPYAEIKRANAYRLKNDYVNAEKYLREVVELPESESINMFYYANILMTKGLYLEAASWFDKYLKEQPNDVVAQALYLSCLSIDDFYEDTTLYTLKAMDLENLNSWFSPTEYRDGIVLTADEEKKLFDKEAGWTGNTYLNLYYTEKDNSGKWLTPEALKGVINGSYHEGPAVFNENEDRVFFTRSNYYKRKLKSDQNDVNNLKIFTADLIDGKWENLRELPFNSDNYSIGHPALSADEQTLFFVSDMPGGYGGTDIYKTTFDGESWSSPENLGPAVNTSQNEMFPYMHKDGTFFFSSNGHRSIGGLDVFVTSQVNGRWLTPENLNYPLNSNKDDFGYVLSDNNRTGYVSSNRTNTDISYEFTKHDPTLRLKVFVVSKKTGRPFPGVTVSIRNFTNNKSEAATTGSNGNAAFDLDMESDYKIVGVKDGYFTKSEKLTTTGQKISRTYEVYLELDELVIDKPIVLENIYYDLDKWFIREDAKPSLDKLVKIMQDNPNIVVELSSHTDARASDHYNLVLSDKRANAAIEYIIAQGIERERITAKGYGESRILNRCTNFVECTEEEHQLNRRTEFKVTKLLDKK